MVLKAKYKTKQREILLWGLFHIAYCFIRVFLSIRCNTSAFGNFLMFPKENSRSFLWKHEKDGTIHPVLPQLYISYGMKRPIGENVLLPDTVRFICEANGYDAEKISQHFLEIPPKISPPEQR